MSYKYKKVHIYNQMHSNILEEKNKTKQNNNKSTQVEQLGFTIIK